MQLYGTRDFSQPTSIENLNTMGIGPKVVVYTYSLLKFLEWHINSRKFSNIEYATVEFNESNTFDTVKLTLLPHYLCTANGNRDRMFGIFDSFSPDKEIGYVENDIASLLKGEVNEKELKLFKYFFPEISPSLKADVMHSLSIFDSSREINRDAYLKEVNKIFGDQDITLSGSEFDVNSMLDEVDHSIESLQRQDYYNEGGILTMKGDALSRLNKVHFHYRLYIQDKLHCTQREDNKREVDLSYLITEKTIFAEKSEKRINLPMLEF